MKYDIFLICPVRNASEEQKSKMLSYIETLEKQGKKIYYPARDTNQNDSIGYDICCQNRNAIINSNEVHIFWDKNSKGSLFDLGIAFATKKPLIIVNLEDVDAVEYKSFENMVVYWSMLSE